MLVNEFWLGNASFLHETFIALSTLQPVFQTEDIGEKWKKHGLSRFMKKCQSKKKHSILFIPFQLKFCKLADLFTPQTAKFTMNHSSVNNHHLNPVVPFQLIIFDQYLFSFSVTFCVKIKCLDNNNSN